MEKYLVPVEPSSEKPTPKVRHLWKRSAIELNGRLEPAYRHELYDLLTQSYSEIRAFRHGYHVDGKPCRTHESLNDRMMLYLTRGVDLSRVFRSEGVTGLEFDSKGIYLASVTTSGCFSVHDFESLYCQAKIAIVVMYCYGKNDADGYWLTELIHKREDESKQVVHFSVPEGLEFHVVRWNPADQNEVACTSRRSNTMCIYDISYISSKPIEVLQTRQRLSVLGSKLHRGLCDVAFTIGEDSRVVCPDTYGTINVWDRRVGRLPCIELSTQSYDSLNTVQINVDNQTIFGAGKEGIIHIWDLRGGRTSAAFQSHNNTCHWPQASWHLATMLQKIETLKAQSAIVPKEIHSIDLNPSCPYQLAFHLDDGWSGVVDVYSSEVTHVHCPPPAWLDGSNASANILYLRRPSWLPTSSTYIVGSNSENGINILDFHPSFSSPCHVDYDEDSKRKKKRRERHELNNKFLPLSEGVVACAAHPLNSTIVTGTEKSSLLLVSQRHSSLSNPDQDQDIKITAYGVDKEHSLKNLEVH